MEFKFRFYLGNVEIPSDKLNELKICSPLVDKIVNEVVDRTNTNDVASVGLAA